MLDDRESGFSVAVQNGSDHIHANPASAVGYNVSSQNGGVEDIHLSSLPLVEPAPISQWERDMEDMERIYDRGFAAWSTVCGAWMVQFCTYGYASSFGVYQDFYGRTFLSEQSPSNISWIGSLQLFLQYAAGLFVGIAFDAGLFHHVVALGVVLQVFSMFMLSLAREHHYYQVLLAQGVGMGLGQALLFLPSLSVVGHHFKSRRALAIGVSVSGSSIGGIFWPIMLNYLSHNTTFPNAIRITAGICGLMLLMSLALMKTQSGNGVSTSPTWASFRPIMMDLPYIVSVASAFCINIGIFFPYFYLQLFAADLGVGKHIAFYSIAVMNAGGFFGRLSPGLLAQKLGIYNLLLLSLFLSSILAFVMLGVTSSTGIVVFAFFYGYWSGSYISLILSLLAHLSRHPGELGVRMGFAFSIVSVSVLIGTPIEGHLLHSYRGDLSWKGAIIFCGCMIFLGTGGMALSCSLFASAGRKIRAVATG